MSNVIDVNKKTPRRNKLGLALAGGGFRASLFHLGVLHRMAELDLLRSVEVLSTVSGGSIIGALYLLLLKKYLEKNSNLTRSDYIAIIKELDHILVKGIRKNLRTRLFMNPLGLLRVLVTSDTLGRRMARIYERYIYQDIVNDIQPGSRWGRFWRPGRMRLRDAQIRPGGNTIEGGIESYNCKAVSSGRSAVTNLILNATCLNSGVPFRFTGAEIGDSRLGFFRHSEIKDLLKRKHLLVKAELKELQPAQNKPANESITIRKEQYTPRTVSLAYWWRSRKEQPDKQPNSPSGWQDLFALPRFPGRMLDADFGQLRRMKLPAWYLRKGVKRTPPVDGGLSPEEQRERFWEGFREIYGEQAPELEAAIVQNAELHELLLDFVLELYYLRCAEIVSFRIDRHWDNLSLGEGVGASACFPPVFPPFIMLDFYDDWHVTRLGLTDGGVYDNVGLSSLFEEQCNYIIASDTSGLFDTAQQSSTGRIGMSGRIVSILMDDVAHAQRENLRERRRAAKRISELAGRVSPPADALAGNDLKGLSFFHMNSPAIGGAGLNLKPDRKLLASIRTDLDGFGEVEIAALVNHGYDMADRYLREYFADYPNADKTYWNIPQTEPQPIHRTDDEVKKILQAGKSRFFRSLKLLAPVSLLFSAAATAVFLWWSLGVSVSVQDVITRFTTQALQWMDENVPFVEAGWTRLRFPLGLVVCVAAAAVAVVTILPKELLDWIKNRYLPVYNKLSTLYKWIRSFSFNVFWFVGYLPLALALAASAVAWISHVFYYLPFKQKTKNPIPQPK